MVGLAAVLNRSERFFNLQMHDAMMTGNFLISGQGFGKSSIDSQFSADQDYWYGVVKGEHALGEAFHVAAQKQQMLLFECGHETLIARLGSVVHGQRGPHVHAQIWCRDQLQANPGDTILRLVMGSLWRSRTLQRMHVNEQALYVGSAIEMWPLVCLNSIQAKNPLFLDVLPRYESMFQAIESALIQMEGALSGTYIKDWADLRYYSAKEMHISQLYQISNEPDTFLDQFAQWQFLKKIGLAGAEIWHHIDHAGGAKESLHFGPIETEKSPWYQSPKCLSAALVYLSNTSQGPFK
jgi:hypothetical protein